MRFDDDEETLVLDVCLPTGEAWHRVTIDEARRFKAEVDNERMAKTRETLEGTSRASSSGPGMRSGAERSGRHTENGYVSPTRRM